MSADTMDDKLWGAGEGSNTANNSTMTKNNNDSKMTNGAIRRSNSKVFAEVLHKHEVPVLFHEPHVETGFRQINQPWTCYLFSIFQVHNECMNTWTHLIALVMVIYKTWHYSKEIDFIGDPHMWPFLFLVMTTVILYICSSGAHCFQNRSELCHYTCFMIDYAGIGMYGFGSVVAHYWYCMETNFYEFAAAWYIEVGAFCAINTCFCCCLSKAIYSRPYPMARRLWQMGSVAAVYTWLNLPILHQIYNCLAHNHKCDASIPLHSAQIGWFLTSAFFFGSDIPQRFFPGKFDFVGHSHQLFHLCILMTTYCQFEAVIVDIQKDHVDIRSRDPPNVFDTFGYGFLILLYQIIIVIEMRNFVKEKMMKAK